MVRPGRKKISINNKSFWLSNKILISAADHLCCHCLVSLVWNIIASNKAAAENYVRIIKKDGNDDNNGEAQIDDKEKDNGEE